MKPRFSNKGNQALTLPELLVVMLTLALLAAIFFHVIVPAGSHEPSKAAYCRMNLKQIDLSFRIWAGDHDNKYPMKVPVADGGAMELVTVNTASCSNVASCFLVMTNELSTPKILVCPEDWGRTPATNFGDDFNDSHISYFVGVDVTNEDFPQRVLIGDDNFLVNGSPVKSGLVQYPTNTSIAWGPGRHGDVPVHHFWTPKPRGFVGNIGYADGSVTELSSAGLQTAFVQSDVATNRLAIP